MRVQGGVEIDGRMLSITHAVDRSTATNLASENLKKKEKIKEDKRNLYLLNEGVFCVRVCVCDVISSE